MWLCGTFWAADGRMWFPLTNTGVRGQTQLGHERRSVRPAWQRVDVQGDGIERNKTGFTLLYAGCTFGARSKTRIESRCCPFD